MMSGGDVKEYLSHHHVPQLLESLLTGLLYHRPNDPVSFLHCCLTTTAQLGGPEAVTWDTFIHLERHQPSPRPSKTTSGPPKTPSTLLKTSSVPPINPQIPPTTPSVPPKITPIPSTTPPKLQITSPIPQTTPLVLPITPSLPPIAPLKLKTTLPIVQTSPITPSVSPIVPPKPQTSPVRPSITQITQRIPPTTHNTQKLQTPSLPPIVPRKLQNLHPEPQTTPVVSSISNKTPCVPPKTAPEPKVLPPAPPGPVVTPPVNPERKEQDTEAFSTEAPLSGPLPPRVQSQISIDSDSDMTESSGLLQEVSGLTAQRPRPLIIFIIGGPGSGKGTQAARLARRFGFGVVSLDELLRRQLLSHASPSRRWEVISEMMGHGQLGAQEETIAELRRQLIGPRGVTGVIVDGFPRDVHQALSFQEQIGCPDLVMLLLCSNETLRCRLQQRAAQLGLLGDNSHALRRRLETFQRDIVSISRYYRQLHLLTQVDADRDQQLVFADLDSAVRDKLPVRDLSDPADFPECSSAVRSHIRSDQSINIS